MNVLPMKPPPFVSTQSVVPSAARNDHRLYERLERVECTVLACQEVNLRSSSVFIGDLAGILGTSEGPGVNSPIKSVMTSWNARRTLCSAVFDGPVGDFSPQHKVATRHGFTEVHPVAIHLLQELQSVAVEMPHLPMSSCGVSYRLNFKFRRAALPLTSSNENT